MICNFLHTNISKIPSDTVTKHMSQIPLGLRTESTVTCSLAEIHITLHFALSLTPVKLLKKFPAFYATRSFVTVFTRTGPCSKPNKSSQHPHTIKGKVVPVLN
jgi:hypothetical protein